MTVPVCWLPLGPDGPPSRGSQWDETLVEACLDGLLWRPPAWPAFHHLDGTSGLPAGEGAVVVVPGRYWSDRPDLLDAMIAPLEWAVIVVASDEESLLAADRPSHPRMVRWTMTPRPGVHQLGGRTLGEGWRPGTPDMLARLTAETDMRPRDWFFAGQVTHRRRRQAADAMRTLPGPGRLIETSRFAAGVPQDEYLAGLASAKLAPAPAGPATPDSFRCYEALEAGCVPVVDEACDGWERPGYWPLVTGGSPPPFPVLSDWARLGQVAEEALAEWPGLSARCSAWWQASKRALAYGLAADVAELSGAASPTAGRGMADLVTVVVTVSPVPSHPSTGILADTVASIRAQEALADCELLVACDGVRADLEHRAGDYGEHVRRVAWRCEHEWPQALPVILDGWHHQSGAAAAALRLVGTPLVLMVEHDTPVCGDIDWPVIAAAILAGAVDLVRLHHEAAVLEPHRHLMVDESPVDIEGCPLLRTVQWSQRPHLASVAYYRRVLADHFRGGARRAFVEDVMHGVVQDAWEAAGVDGWRRHRLALYAPAGSMVRSRHTDGRGADAKAPGWVDAT